LRLDPQTETASHNLPLAVWAMIFRGRWWVLGFLLFSVPVTLSAVAAENTAFGIGLRLFGVVALFAAAVWLLWWRLVRVFPANMRLAARRVLARDRLVRPAWLGQAWALALQMAMVAVLRDGDLIWVFLWTGALGVGLSTLVSFRRMKRTHAQLQRERFHAWWGVVNPSQGR
ncbi:MAG: hypothetical protein ACRDPW_04615, partial [Mycobacteriales bacterium]